MKFAATFIACCMLLIAVCGAAPEGRIVGGDDAIVGQLPYQAALSIGGSYNCGAVILSENYALTALVCVCSAGSNKPWAPQLFMVSAGTVDLYTGGQRIRVEEITINPNYNELNLGVALLRLTEPFVFNDAVSAVPLAREDPPYGGEVEISGWGRIKEGEANMYRTLQLNEATVLDEADCRRAKNGSAYNPELLCLGHMRKNGICRGDIGGPAVYRETLVGLAAEVLGECGSMLPDVFISIAANYDWIVNQLA